MDGFDIAAPIVVENDSSLKAQPLALQSPATEDTPSLPIYYPYFDYLRIALAVVVMLVHDRLIPWENSGNLAVQVFFALSGWLIGGALLKLAPHDLPRFYFNRILRIWIPYYIALLLLVIASLLRDPINAKWAEFVFYKLTFVFHLFGRDHVAAIVRQMPLQGTGSHFWSVNAEEQFYLVAPVVLVITASKVGRSVIFWSVLTLVAWLGDTYSSIVFGVLAAVIVHHHGAIHRQPVAIGILWTATIVTSLGLIAGLNYALIAPIFSIGLVLLLAIKGNPTPIGQFVGGMSYPLYLNHWIGVFIGNALFAPWDLKTSPLRSMLSLVLNFGIAAALYWTVDRRIVTLRRQLFTPRRGKLAIFCAYGLTLVGLIGGTVMTWGKTINP
jgi:peptidoglycan/LPS O-acetylase OafA/YrhL